MKGPLFPIPSVSIWLVSGLTFLGLRWCLGKADCQCILGWCHDPGRWRWGTLWLAGSTSGGIGGGWRSYLILVVSYGPNLGVHQMGLVVYLVIYNGFLYMMIGWRCWTWTAGVYQRVLCGLDASYLVVCRVSASKNNTLRSSKCLLEWWLLRLSFTKNRMRVAILRCHFLHLW